MSRTGYTVAAAALLTVLSAACLLTRRHMLGADINGPVGNSSWEVSLDVEGTIPEDRTAIITLPPLDFRRQHIYDEHFSSDVLKPRPMHTKGSGRREIVWQRKNLNGEQPFHLTYTFECALGLWPPTPGMEHVTAAVDGEPDKASRYLKPGFHIESQDRDIFKAARRLVRRDMDMNPADRALALFNWVRKLDAREAPAGQSAVECLRLHGGGSAGRSRLLVALCRNRDLPARLMCGLILDGDGPRDLHYWAEVYVQRDWLPMCPTRGHFGRQAFPKNYLVLNVGEQDVVRGGKSILKANFAAEKLVESSGGDADAPAWGSSFWRKLSLYRLRPPEQHLVRFLLLLPLAALIVSFFRTVIGLPTFGTFAPALMGMAFLDLDVLPWGLTAFAVLVLAGWALRRLLDRFHLLMVPRVSVLLTLLVLMLVTGIVVGANFGLPATSYMALFPLVILTHLVERFWTVESEDGTAASFKTLAGTFFVAATVSLALCWPAVGTWMFRYPETTGVVLACQLLLGRYTGYRLTELYRFSDLIQEEEAADGMAGTLAEAPREGYPGDEHAERRVHPGPEPAEPVPAGGRQAADA
jgi:transglutaminase-like putative cysteine protease